MERPYIFSHGPLMLYAATGAVNEFERWQFLLRKVCAEMSAVRSQIHGCPSL